MTKNTHVGHKKRGARDRMTEIKVEHRSGGVRNARPRVDSVSPRATVLFKGLPRDSERGIRVI
jgi:hypothetical protein